MRLLSRPLQGRAKPGSGKQAGQPGFGVDQPAEDGRESPFESRGHHPIQTAAEEEASKPGRH